MPNNFIQQRSEINPSIELTIKIGIYVEVEAIITIIMLIRKKQFKNLANDVLFIYGQDPTQTPLDSPLSITAVVYIY